MGDTHIDPVDHSRTTRQHAGETFKNGFNAPGLVLMAVGVASLVLALAAYAQGHLTSGTVGVGVAVIAAAAGGTWLFVSHRRVRKIEMRRAAALPEADAPPPNS